MREINSLINNCKYANNLFVKRMIHESRVINQLKNVNNVEFRSQIKTNKDRDEINIYNPSRSRTQYPAVKTHSGKTISDMTKKTRLFNWAETSAELFPKNLSPILAKTKVSSLPSYLPLFTKKHTNLTNYHLTKLVNLQSLDIKPITESKKITSQENISRIEEIKKDKPNTYIDIEKPIINDKLKYLLKSLKNIPSNFRKVFDYLKKSVNKFQNSISELFLSKNELQNLVLKRRLSDATEKYNFQNLYNSDPLKAREYARDYLAYKMQDEVNHFIKNTKDITPTKLNNYYESVVEIARNIGIEADINHFGNDNIYLDIKAPQGKPEISLMREIAHDYDGDPINILHPEMKSLSGFMINLAEHEYETLLNQVNTDIHGVYADKINFDCNSTLYEMRQLQKLVS